MNTRIKVYLLIPLAILDKVFSKIFNYIPFLNYKWKKLAAILDDGESIGIDYTIKHEFKRLKISDISNSKLRRSLYLSNFPRRWKVYYVSTNENTKINSDDSLRQIIYISKDNLSINDQLIRRRINDDELNNNLKLKSIRKFRKNQNLKPGELYKIEPQIYVIVAKYTDMHKKQENERDKRYAKLKQKSLEKLVKNAIRNDMLFSYQSGRFLWDRNPILFKIVENDRIDLAEKLLNAALDSDEQNDLVTYKLKSELDYGKTPIDFAKSEEMKLFLNKYIKNG